MVKANYKKERIVVMHKSFSFKGIARHTDNILSTEGECVDAVNLRMENGSLSPLPQAGTVAELQGEYRIVKWHEMAGCYLCVDIAGEVHPYDKEWNPLKENGSLLRFKGLTGVKKIEFIGNLVCCLRDSSIDYILYDTGTYRLLGNSPQLPVLEILPQSKVQQLITESSFYVTSTVENLEASWKYNEKGYIDECISVLGKEGYYIDRALFRFALRLYDGSYINCSHIIYVSDSCRDDNISRDAGNMQSESMGGNDGVSRYKVRVRGFKPSFKFSNLNLDAWRGVVVGIDLFSTPSITGKQVESALRTQSDPETGIPAHRTIESYVVKKPADLWNDIANSSLYYKVAEFDIEGNLLFALDDVSPTNLVLQTSLTSGIHSFSPVTVAAGCSYVLNDRLHIGALKELLFKGYDSSSLCLPTEGDVSMAAVTVHTVVETTGGTKTVVNELGDIALCCNNGKMELPPLLSYPDSRAVSMRVYINVEGEIVARTFKLTAHNNLNISQYLHKWSSPYSVSVSAVFANGGSPAAVDDEDVLAMFNYTTGVYEVVYSEEQGCWTYDGKRFPDAPYNTLRIFGIYRDIVDGDKLVFDIREKTVDSDSEFTDINNIPVDSGWEAVDTIPLVSDTAFEVRSNVIKVSQAGNPFVFPASATYTPSQGRVVAMASNTVALSQGQFGQHPLYVFCSDGIWALSADVSGTIAYAGCFPLSREKCTQPNSVCGIDSGVVFAGEQGLMLLRGSSIKKLSGAMECIPAVSSILFSPVIEKIASLVSMQGIKEDISFENFLSAATVAYLAAYNEIVVANQSCGYTYIYSVEYGAWSRMTERIAGFVNDYSHFMFFTAGDGATRIFSLDKKNEGGNRVLLLTRPQPWGTKLPKRVIQLMLHATVSQLQSRAPASPLLAAYMLGSNDGVNFKIVAGSETQRECCDLHFPYYPSQSYRYFLFAVVGELGCNSLITGFELEIAPAWNNRIN